MKIRRCSDCPFCEVTLLSMFGGGERAGVCSYDATRDALLTAPEPPIEPVLRERLFRRLRIPDQTQPPPDGCPLRTRDVTLHLSPEN
jgi:hypothetical protein